MPLAPIPPAGSFSHFEIFTLIASAKPLVPYKVTFVGSRGQGLVFVGGRYSVCHRDIASYDEKSGVLTQCRRAVTQLKALP